MNDLLAHVVAPPGNHLFLLWPTSAVLGGGVVFAFVARRRRWRRAWAVVAAVGLVATALVYLLEPSYAAPPPFGIRLVVAPGPGDAAVQVCPVLSRGSSPAVVPPSGDLIDVFVDGKVHAESSATLYLLPLPAGTYSFWAEMVQSDHVAFLPAEVTPTVHAVVPPGVGTELPETSC